MNAEAADFTRLRHVYGGFNAAFDIDAIRDGPLRVRHTDDREAVLIETGAGRGDGEAGAGYWEVLRVNDDFLICVANDYYDERFRFDVRTGMDTVTIRFVRAGELGLQEAGNDAFVTPACSASVARLSSERAYELMIRERQRLLSVTVHIRADRLWSEVGLEPGEAPALHALLGETRDGHAAIPMTAGMNNGVMDILSNRLRGGLRQRYIEVKSQELLCLFFESMQRFGDRAPKDAPLRPHHRARLEEARELLLQRFTDPPSVDSLARQVGLNRTTLRQGFKQLFGETIADFCQTRRMMLAQELLRDGRHSIADIAEIVGYGQSTNFTAAFRRHFNALPSAFRR